VDERNGRRNVYFVCDFNGKWLKDLSFLYCFDVLLSVEGSVVLMIMNLAILKTFLGSFHVCHKYALIIILRKNVSLIF
jgi:hypothetical protein